MSPQDVKVGGQYFVHPFKIHPNAGSKVVIQKRYGVDFFAIVIHTGESIDLFFSEMWRGKWN